MDGLVMLFAILFGAAAIAAMFFCIMWDNAWNCWVAYKKYYVEEELAHAETKKKLEHEIAEHAETKRILEEKEGEISGDDERKEAFLDDILGLITDYSSDEVEF